MTLFTDCQLLKIIKEVFRDDSAARYILTEGDEERPTMGAHRFVERIAEVTISDFLNGEQ